MYPNNPTRSDIFSPLLEKFDNNSKGVTLKHVWDALNQDNIKGYEYINCKYVKMIHKSFLFKFNSIKVGKKYGKKSQTIKV